MTAEHVISYRLNDAEWEALKALQLNGEKSVSLTAKRLLKEVLGMSTGMSTARGVCVDNVDEVIDKILGSSRFKDLLGDEVAYLVNSVNGKFEEYEERLESLEKLEA